jgi:hypothetical protein
MYNDRDDFYIILFSDANHHEFPNNSPKNFTNKIEPRLELGDGEYKVAIWDMQLLKSWYNYIEHTRLAVLQTSDRNELASNPDVRGSLDPIEAERRFKAASKEDRKKYYDMHEMLDAASGIPHDNASRRREGFGEHPPDFQTSSDDDVSGRRLRRATQNSGKHFYLDIRPDPEKSLRFDVTLSSKDRSQVYTRRYEQTLDENEHYESYMAIFNRTVIRYITRNKAIDLLSKHPLELSPEAEAARAAAAAAADAAKKHEIVKKRRRLVTERKPNGVDQYYMMDLPRLADSPLAEPFPVFNPRDIGMLHEIVNYSAMYQNELTVKSIERRRPVQQDQSLAPHWFDYQINQYLNLLNETDISHFHLLRDSISCQRTMRT